MNIGLMAAAAGSLAALSMTVLWQIEKNTTLALKGDLQVLLTKFDQQKSENLRLLNAVDEAKNVSKKNIALVEKNTQRMAEYGDQLLLAEKENNQLAIKINELRTSEMENAIDNPYQRGNAAADRWANVMQRIAGATSTDSKGINNTDAAAAGIATESGTANTH
jgi:hypothetical protein